MLKLICAFWLALAIWGIGTVKTGMAQETGPSPTHSPSTRQFKFFYRGTIRDLPASSHVRVWLPVARSSPHQDIGAVKWQLPVEAEIREEPTWGNRILYFEFSPRTASDLPFSTEYDVIRREVHGLDGGDGETLDEQSRALALKANRLVPVDGRPLELLESLSLPTEPVPLAQLLYERVGQHMTYDKSVPGYGNGDSVWACDSGVGNCTDFHSLFMSLARSQNIPVRFEIGFPLPPDQLAGTIQGYHCWASFFVDGQGWVPVDISEADKHPDRKSWYFGNLTPDRVTFSVGRDIDLEPRQNGPPLNYFVYPYVEVGGQIWPAEKIELEFRFAEIPESGNPGDDESGE